MDMNAREELEAAAHWLGYQHEDLSFGLKSAEDAIKLWRAWTSNPALPEFCDVCETLNEGRRFRALMKKTLGYDPWKHAVTSA
jgi:hypothetical protein